MAIKLASAPLLRAPAKAKLRSAPGQGTVRTAPPSVLLPAQDFDRLVRIARTLNQSVPTVLRALMDNFESDKARGRSGPPKRQADAGRRKHPGRKTASTPVRLSSRTELLIAAARRLVAPGITVPELVAGMAILKQIANAHVASNEPASTVLAHSAESGKDHHPKIDIAIQRLESARGGLIGISEKTLCAEIGLHPSHFGRLLKAQTGLGWREWRLGCQMQGALHGIILRGERCDDVARRNGWSSPQQFSRQFRALTGLSPTELRQAVSKSPGRTGSE